MLPDLNLSRRSLLGSLLILPLSSQAENDWIPLFDGRSLDGWKASESNTSFRVVDGLIAADGPRSHLFYTGGVHNASFKNFELKVDVLTKRGCNSGVYFHTEFQPAGFPAKGFEVQVNNTYVGEGGYRERKKTASLYAIRDIYKAFVKDDEWFQMRVLVRGKQVQVFLNDMLLVDYIEPDPPLAGRRLDRGTFALQCHNPGSRALFRNILVRPLPDDAAPPNTDQPVADDLYREIVRLNAENYPVVDYHSHLNGGLTVEDVLRESRRTGIQYGIALNCGQGFPIHDDAGVAAFVDRMKGQPVFVALQGEGREWVNLVSKETLARLDYVFTDAMTFTDDNGKRMRLWIKGEVGQIDDPQRFMDVLVNRILTILGTEPIDIYVNPTYVPDVIAHMYDELWTPERMHKVIEAAKKRDIAIEINNRYKIPKAPFIRLAKQAGVRFSFGTNNDTRELGRLEYPIQMVKECGLGWQDIFVPRSAT
ncbi:MAG TPA: family 16 glycoside hydrolase [Bryobacteraceae bacterium]|nr:family 16 glycoside hydrolase [Bryobacteraceae bacterium]